MSIHITYSNNGFGTAYGDWESELQVLNAVENGLDIHTTTENIVNAARMLIAEDRISSQAIKFVFENEVLVCNEFGALQHYPKGFCDCMHKQVKRILRAACTKGKKNGKDS